MTSLDNFTLIRLNLLSGCDVYTERTAVTSVVKSNDDYEGQIFQSLLSGHGRIDFNISIWMKSPPILFLAKGSKEGKQHILSLVCGGGSTTS